MPRVVSNKEAMELSEKGKAAYEGGTDPMVINQNVAQVLKSCNDIIASVSSYYETFIDVDAGASLRKEISNLTTMLHKAPSVGGDNKEIMAACDSINANVNQMYDTCNSIMTGIKNYHESVVAKINVSPDMSHMQEMNKKLATLIQLVSSQKVIQKNKEWDFNVMKDINGQYKINAKEVTH